MSTRAIGLLLLTFLAVSATTYGQSRCWEERGLDEVFNWLGPASASERIRRSAANLGKNAWAGHWHFQSFLAHRTLGNDEAAAEELSAAIQSEPDNAAYWVALTWVRLGEGNLQGALGAAQEQVKLDPRNPLSRCMLGQILEGLDDAGAALREFRACQRAIEKRAGDDCHAGGFVLGAGSTVDHYFVSTRWDSRAATSASTELVLLGPVFDGPCSIGIVHPSKGVNLDFAGRYYAIYGLHEFVKKQISRLMGKGRAKTPSEPFCKVPACVPAFRPACPTPEDLEEVLRETAINLRAETNPVWAYWHAQSALGNFLQGRRAEALRHVEEGIRNQPGSSLFYLLGARIARDAGLTQAYLDQALAIDPENPWVHFRLGEHFERTRNRRAAIAHYELCLENLGSPSDISIVTDLAEVRKQGTAGLGEEVARRLTKLKSSTREQR